MFLSPQRAIAFLGAIAALTAQLGPALRPISKAAHRNGPLCSAELAERMMLKQPLELGILNRHSRQLQPQSPCLIKPISF